jgi:RNA polymerase sigma-70 factor (ECF subfamily)
VIPGDSFLAQQIRLLLALTHREAPKPPMPASVNQTLEQFRAYLECLTAIQVDPRLRIDPALRQRFGWSDIINATLLEAFQMLERIQAMSQPEQERWLRTMLANNLVDRIRRELARSRDARLERSLEEAIEASSCRLGNWLPAEESTPSEKLIRQEQALCLANALAQLPERQREALILQRWHGWKLARIAAHLQCTVGVVGGLLARGLETLRKLLPQDLLETS